MPYVIGWEDESTRPSVVIGDRIEPLTDEVALALAEDAMLLALSPDQAEALLAKSDRQSSVAALQQ